MRRQLHLEAALHRALVAVRPHVAPMVPCARVQAQLRQVHAERLRRLSHVDHQHRHASLRQRLDPHLLRAAVVAGPHRHVTRVPVPLLVDGDRLRVRDDVPHLVHHGRVRHVEAQVQRRRHDAPRPEVRAALRVRARSLDVTHLQHVRVRPAARPRQRRIPLRPRDHVVQAAGDVLPVRHDVQRDAVVVARAVRLVRLRRVRVQLQDGRAGGVDQLDKARVVLLRAALVHLDRVEAVVHDGVHVADVLQTLRVRAQVAAVVRVQVPAHFQVLRVDEVTQPLQVRELLQVDDRVARSVVVPHAPGTRVAEHPPVVDAHVRVPKLPQAGVLAVHLPGLVDECHRLAADDLLADVDRVVVPRPPAHRRQDRKAVVQRSDSSDQGQARRNPHRHLFARVCSRSSRKQ
eukprot:Rhum_TRINITY_DN14919_c1_g2::Rhum_TRINITY_DN14919_c1_g2_i2::g.127350::m.127350